MDKANVLQIYSGTLLSHKKNKIETDSDVENRLVVVKGVGRERGEPGLADESHYIWNG